MKQEQLQNNILAVLSKLGFDGESVSVAYDDKMHTLWFSITSPHTRLLLLRDAEALAALNHIARKMAEQVFKEEENRLRIVIDANNIEKKKIDNLKATAHMMAERARYFKSSVEVEPMSAHDRKVVHEFLSAFPDLKTESAGEGSARHIVIKYIGGI